MYSFINLFSLAIVWGLFFSLARFAGESGIPKTSLITCVTVLDVIAFLVICRFRGIYPKLRRSSFIFYGVCAAFGYLLPMQLELYAAPIIGAGLLTMLVSLTPVITMVIALVIGHEHVSRSRIAGILLAVVAMLPLFYQDLSAASFDGTDRIIAMCAALVVACCYGIYHNYIAVKWPDGEDGWQLATGEAIACSAMMLPVLMITGGADLHLLADFTASWVIVAYVILSVSSIYLYFYLIKLGGAVYVSMAGFLTLGFGVGFGIWLFDERYPWWVALCVAGLMGATFLASRKTDNPGDSDEDNDKDRDRNGDQHGDKTVAETPG